MSGYPPPPNQPQYPQYPPPNYPPPQVPPPQGPPQYPPQYGGYPPPPVQPPRKSNRGAIIGVGALLAVIIIAVGGFFIAKGRSGGSATPTPTPQSAAIAT